MVVVVAGGELCEGGKSWRLLLVGGSQRSKTRPESGAVKCCITREANMRQHRCQAQGRNRHYCRLSRAFSALSLPSLITCLMQQDFSYNLVLQR
jgi:hypothetical protein